MLLGPLAALILNQKDEKLSPWLSKLLEKLSSDERVKKAVFNQGSHLEKLIWTSLHKEKLLLVTTDSRKVYIGYAKSDSHPHAPNEDLDLLKVLSGYRNWLTGELDITTEYMDLIEALGNDHDSYEAGDFSPLESEDFVIAIPFREIVSASLFDIDVFASYMDGKLDLDTLIDVKQKQRE